MSPQAYARRTVFALLLVSVVLAFLLHIGVGSSVWMSPIRILSELFAGPNSGDAMNDIVWRVRLPRALGCILIGGVLGAVGSAFQSLLKNPLAEPYVIGVSAGASVGGAIALVTGLSAGLFGLGGITMACAGGILSLGLVLWIAQRHGSVRTESLILSGVIVGTMLSSVLTIVLLSAGQDTNRVLRWLLGSMTPMFWRDLLILAILGVVGITILFLQTRLLNAFAVSESSAFSLGIDAGRLRRIVLLTSTVMTSVCVGIAGIIGFLGLIAPHMSRKLLGADLRRSLLGATLLGSSLLLFADLLAQRIVAGTELPVGAVTALLGSPTLIVLLRRGEKV